MNSVNTLFVISTIMVPLLLISLNYTAIDNFYGYVVPLNSFIIEKIPMPTDPDRYQRIKAHEDSTCFLTPTNNEYCYEFPRGDEEFRVSHPIGSNEINGEMHFEPVNNANGYWTMSNINSLSNNTAIITFSDNSERYPSETLSRWHITNDFEFTKKVEKYDTFVSYCSNDGKYLSLMQYLGIITVEDTDYVVTWHTGAVSEQGVTCKYPQIIQNSFSHDFGI